MNFQFMHVDSSPYDYAMACIQFLVASLNANGCKALHRIIHPITMNINADISSDLQNLSADCLRSIVLSILKQVFFSLSLFSSDYLFSNCKSSKKKDSIPIIDSIYFIISLLLPVFA